jgi:ABC-2 type transport system ATP-binding protein
MEAAFRECIEEERQGGRTVLLSSHILSEVEALCDRVTIIRAGRTVETGTLTELRHLTRTAIAAELSSPPEGLDTLPGVHDLVIDASPAGAGPPGARLTRVRCEVDSEQLAEVLKRLVAAGVRSLVSQPPTLEELFLRHYAAEPQAAAGQPAAGQPA